MIKKTFKDFISILESNDDDETKLDSWIKSTNPRSWRENSDFLHRFNLAIEELPGLSWTSIAMDRYNQLESDEAWKNINQELKSVGLTWEDVKKNKQVISENMTTYSSVNAYVDIMLYNLFPNYDVSGEVPEGFHDELPEFTIKYGYGYHKTTYGRVFINRWFGSVDKFIQKAARNILQIFCIKYDRLFLDIDEIVEEVEEENGLVYFMDGILDVYFDQFYMIAKPKLINKNSYENLKDIFIEFIRDIEGDSQVEDDGDVIKIDFGI